MIPKKKTGIIHSILLFNLILVFISMVPAGKVLAQAYHWSSVRIGGGGATISIKAHPRVPGLFFMTTDVGNPYRWNEKAQHWEGLLNAVPASLWNTGACANLAIDPNDDSGNILYATVGKYAFGPEGFSGKLIKSVDRGDSWKDAGLSIKVRSNKDRFCGERIIVDPQNSNVIYVTSFNDGTYRSENKGASWKKISDLNGEFIGFDQSQGKLRCVTKNVIIGCKDGIYRSDNAGDRFLLMPGSPKNLRRAAFHKDGIVYVTNNLGVFKYNGKTWNNISPERTSYLAVAVNPAECNEVIVSPNAGIVPNYYISKDGGTTWRKIIKKPDFSEIPFAERSHFSLSTFDLCWDPFRHTQVWFSDFFNAFQAENVWAKEVTWKARAIGHEEVVTLGVLVCPPSGPNELLSCVADLGGFDHQSILRPPAVSMYKFFPWAGPGLLSGNITGVAIQETNPKFIARVGRRGWDGMGVGGWSNDGGLHYQQWKCPADGKGGKIAVSASNETMVWATQDGPVYRSVNRGKTWDTVAGTPIAAVGPGNTFTYINPLAADKVNGQKFYLYNDGKCYVSDNGGISFHIAANNLPVVSNKGLMKIETTPGIEGDMWLSLQDKGLFHSVNSGNSFNRIDAVEYSGLFACGKAASSIPAIYVFGKVNHINDGLFRSDDYGKNWVQIDTQEYKMGMEPNSMAADRITYGKIFVGTNGNGIYVGQPQK